MQKLAMFSHTVKMLLESHYSLSKCLYSPWKEVWLFTDRSIFSPKWSMQYYLQWWCKKEHLDNFFGQPSLRNDFAVEISIDSP